MTRLCRLSVQLLFKFLDQFLIVGFNAKVSKPSYRTALGAFARDLIFQRREQSSVAGWDEKLHVPYLHV